MSTRKKTQKVTLATLNKKLEHIEKILEIAQKAESWCDHEWELPPNVSSTWFPLAYCKKCGMTKMDFDMKMTRKKFPRIHS